VIVDGNDVVLGLAGVMGGASSEITGDTTEVLLEAASFEPLVIAQTSKRHGLRSEASSRFERGVDPQLALRAVARYVAILGESVPDLEWLAAPLDVRGNSESVRVVELRQRDIERLLGVAIPDEIVANILRGLDFGVERSEDGYLVTVPSRRLDVREGAAGRADIIEEIARLYSYQRLPRRSPAWPEVGGLTRRQKMRRRVRDVVVDVGAFEVWTPSLCSEAEFDLLHKGVERVRVTNPLSSGESVLRATLLTGLLGAWAKNAERGLGDVVLAEFGVVFLHPRVAKNLRTSRGGVGGVASLTLPGENERLTVILGRRGDDAASAVALWKFLEERLGLLEVVVRASEESPVGLHPSRSASLVDRTSATVVGFVGEVDPQLVDEVSNASVTRRLGVLDLDLDVLVDTALVARRSDDAVTPSKYPSAIVDLALVAPRSLNAADLAHALRSSCEVVESVTLFDVYQGAGLELGTRSLTYRIRFSAPDRTLSEREVTENRLALIASANANGARLR
jgi:phenylalanyl-tRNA synthetase beta chain